MLCKLIDGHKKLHDFSFMSNYIPYHTHHLPTHTHRRYLRDDSSDDEFGWWMITLGDFLCIRTPITGQLNPPFHTFAELRPIVNRVVARQSTDLMAVNAQFSPYDLLKLLLCKVKRTKEKTKLLFHVFI